jgi:hypothetical protein
MKSHIKLAMLALAATGVSGLATGSAHAAECKNFAAIGTGLTQELAKYLADHGIANVAADKGYTPTGPISYKCENGTIGIDCHAHQKACK